MKRQLFNALAFVSLFAEGFAPWASAEEPGQENTAQAAVILPFDFYPRHCEELGLNEGQVSNMQRIAEGMREAAQKLEAERGRRFKTLQEAMAQNPVDLDKAMERFQAVLDAENQLKALQFRSGIAMRNTLRPEQVKNLQALAVKEAASRGVGARAELNDRLQQLRAEVHKRSGGEPPPEIVEQVRQIEQSVKDGRFPQAKNQLEQVLQRLRSHPR